MKNLGTYKLLPILGLAALALVGCGNAKYQKQEFQATAVAGQYVKPKIDIVVFQDMSDSMRTPVQNMKGQLDSFVSGIDSTWDFRFTVLPLQSTMNANTKYILAQDCSSVTVGTCLTAAQSAAFNGSAGDYGWINSIDSSIGNTDLGFQYIYSNMMQSSMQNGFLRADAALAVIVLSNGEDVTGVSYKDRGDGVQVLDYNSAASQNSFQSYRAAFQGFKASASLSKFYSVVAQSAYSNCWGGAAWQGKRYQDMSSALNSRSFNICGSGLSNALADIRNHLSSLVTAIEFDAVVMNEKPLVSSIVVKKNGVTIPQGTANGWTYIGYQANQPTSYSPAAGNNKTGYFLKLNGTARYKGSDQISVDYKRE